MKKNFIIALSVSFIFFLLSSILLNTYKKMPDSIDVELEAIVLKDDLFRLFYKIEGETNYSPVIEAKVSGNNKLQKIKFTIPVTRPINLLRIDIGENANQDSIIIKDVIIKSLFKDLQYDINKDFYTNTCVISDGDGKFKTKIVETAANKYNPLFMSKFDVKLAYEQLIQAYPVLSWNMIVLFSLIISSSVFFIVYYRSRKKVFWGTSIFISIFVSILFVPIIVSVMGINIKAEITEKRKLAVKPVFEMTDEYPKKFETYYNDNFGLRTMLVNWNSNFKFNFFNAAPASSFVLIGKDGFLFYNNTDAYNSYSHSNLVENEKLEYIYKKQLKIKNELTAKGIKYIVGFFPNKHTIYEEMFSYPMRLQVKGDVSFADQIVKYFDERSFQFVDVRKDLLDAKGESQLYRKNDSHWNAYGAYITYNSFCKQTSNMLGLVPYDTSYFNIDYSIERTGGLTNAIGVEKIKSYYDERPVFTFKQKVKTYKNIGTNGFPKNTVITINENCGNTITVLVFRDSYTTEFIPFLSQNFYKVIYIWQFPIDMDLITKTNPDVVMSFCVERLMYHLLW